MAAKDNPQQPLSGEERGQSESFDPAPNSSVLLERVWAGNPEAWHRLVRLYGPMIYRWCRQATVPPEAAADVVQEVLSAVTAHLPDFRRNRPQDGLTSWLAKASRNTIRRHCPKPNGRDSALANRLEPGVSAESSQPTDRSEEDFRPDPQSPACLSRGALEIIRKEFEPCDWDAFWRVCVGREPPADVAVALGITVAGVYRVRSRVLARLRQILSELPE